MRLISPIPPASPTGSLMRGVIPLGFILLSGCATHRLRCDTHLAPINPPEPPAATTDAKPSGRGSP